MDMTEFTVKTKPMGKPFWVGLGKSVIDFEFALAELIDNAISTYPPGESFLIEIIIEKSGPKLKIEVGDNSSGISQEDLSERAMRPGGRASKGTLNEHGFGFKNAMTVFTQAEQEFSLYTATEDLDSSKVLKVGGVYPDLSGDDDVNRDEWNGHFSELGNYRGTRIFFETTYDYFGSVYQRGEIFETLISALIEHIGVIYRDPLSERKHNQIFLKWRDVKEDSGWTKIEAFPIEPPYLEKKVDEKIGHEMGGEELECRIVLGRIDDSEKDIPYTEDPIEVKRRNYYRGTTGTAGVNVIKGKRVLIPHTFSLLWDEPTRHAEVRKWIGELYLDPSIETVNNKTNVNVHDPKWIELRKILQKEKYKPKREKGPLESKIGEGISSAIRASSIDINAKIYKKQTFWHNVQIDLVKSWNNDGSEPDLESADNYVLYEIKRAKSTPINLYQLMMYWDALVAGGKQPKKAILVAKDHTPGVNSIKDYLNNRTDSQGNNYKFILQKHEQYNIES